MDHEGLRRPGLPGFFDACYARDAGLLTDLEHARNRSPNKPAAQAR